MTTLFFLFTPPCISSYTLVTTLHVYLYLHEFVIFKMYKS